MLDRSSLLTFEASANGLTSDMPDLTAIDDDGSSVSSTASSDIEDVTPPTSHPSPPPSPKPNPKDAIPNVYVPDAVQPQKPRRLTPFELHKLFGCRRLKNYKLLEEATLVKIFNPLSTS